MNGNPHPTQFIVAWPEVSELQLQNFVAHCCRFLQPHLQHKKKLIYWCYYLLNSHGGWEMFLAGRGGCVSGRVDCCPFSWIWGILTRGGTCGVWSCCISSANVLVGEGLQDTDVPDRSTQGRQPGGETSGMLIWDRLKITRSLVILFILFHVFQSGTLLQTPSRTISTCRQKR